MIKLEEKKLNLQLEETFAQMVWRRFKRHRRLARWTLPIWLYVSFTGLFVYYMLYHS